MSCQDFRVFPGDLGCYGPHPIKVAYWLIITANTYITYSDLGTFLWVFTNCNSLTSNNNLRELWSEETKAQRKW